MAEVISMYRNDVLPDLEVTFVDYDVSTGAETPSDLSAVGIVVRLKTRPLDGGAIKTNATLTAVDALQGKFKHVWQTTDTDTVGEYLGEISIEYPDGANPPKVRTALQFQLSVLEDIV